MAMSAAGKVFVTAISVTDHGSRRAAVAASASRVRTAASDATSSAGRRSSTDALTC